MVRNRVVLVRQRALRRDEGRRGALAHKVAIVQPQRGEGGLPRRDKVPVDLRRRVVPMVALCEGRERPAVPVGRPRGEGCERRVRRRPVQVGARADDVGVRDAVVRLGGLDERHAPPDRTPLPKGAARVALAGQGYRVRVRVKVRVRVLEG